MLRRSVLAVLAALALVTWGCSDGDEAGETTTTPAPDAAESTTTTAAGGDALEILVSNDDGVDGPGLDLMVRALLEMPDVELTIVAPAGNQSGTSDDTTDGGASFTGSETAGGAEATAVDGFPADTVLVALDELDLEPDVIVSGINEGQNIGPFAELSGTVGVVRTGIRRDVPGIAASAGDEFDEAQYDVAARLVVDWLTENRDALVDGTFPTDVAYSVNVPSCEADQIGDLVVTARATEFPPDLGNPFESTCDLSDPEPSDDVAAVRVGYPSLTPVPAEL